MTLEFSQLAELIILLCGVVGTIATVKMQIKAISKDITRLEKKQDKHNGLIERMAVVEQSCKSAHYRMDSIEEREAR